MIVDAELSAAVDDVRTESAHEDDVVATIDLLAAFLETETGDHDYSL